MADFPFLFFAKRRPFSVQNGGKSDFGPKNGRRFAKNRKIENLLISENLLQSLDNMVLQSWCDFQPKRIIFEGGDEFLLVFQKSLFSQILAIFTTFCLIISKFGPYIAIFVLFFQIWAVSRKQAQFQAYSPHFDEINSPFRSFCA